MTGEMTEARANVLLVEDDPAVAMMLKDVLEAEGYAVRHASTAAAAKTALDGYHPDLIILDLMLPDADGLVLCSDLKARTDASIIVCSATNRRRDAILALKLGADDFIPKPFDVDELLTRIEAVRRRTKMGQRQASPGAGSSPMAPSMAGTVPSGLPVGPNQDGVTVGPLKLEHARRRVTLADEELQLTPTEYRLLSTLMSRPDEVFSRQDLAQLVWGYEDASIGRSIDVHVHRLRAKMQAAQERAGVAAPTVVSVRGFGYKLMPEVGASSQVA
jgi:two-component system, OmpR family, alkaline phosphatase synthesis response regulator PhoP